MIDIIPAILTNDPQELEKKIKLLEKTGLVGRVQIDIVDGVFAEHKTIELEAVAQIETSLQLDIHLMCNEPEVWVQRALDSMPDRLIAQIEKMSSQEDFAFGQTAISGTRVGLALDMATPVANLDLTLLPNVDVILLLAVKAGLGGQEFDSSVLAKVKELDRIRARDNLLFNICVDGGVNSGNLQYIADTGADEVAVGSSLFEGSLEANLTKLLKVAEQYEI